MDFYQIIHPFLWRLAKLRHKPKIHILNSPKEIHSNKIYAVNHSCVHDIPILIHLIQIIKNHFYLLMGKQSLNVIDRMFFNLNGTVWVDRQVREDRRMASAKLRYLLEKGESILMFPEGTWNMTESKPMLPLH